MPHPQTEPDSPLTYLFLTSEFLYLLLQIYLSPRFTILLKEAFFYVAKESGGCINDFCFLRSSLHVFPT
jgi:hypothetical protein